MTLLSIWACVAACSCLALAALMPGGSPRSWPAHCAAQAYWAVPIGACVAAAIWTLGRQHAPAWLSPANQVGILRQPEMCCIVAQIYSPTALQQLGDCLANDVGPTQEHADVALSPCVESTGGGWGHEYRMNPALWQHVGVRSSKACEGDDTCADIRVDPTFLEDVVVPWHQHVSPRLRASSSARAQQYRPDSHSSAAKTAPSQPWRAVVGTLHAHNATRASIPLVPVQDAAKRLALVRWALRDPVHSIY